LRLLSLMQARQYWPGPELAERLGVSERTLRRDVDRLRELGYPVQANPGVDGGYRLAAGAALPPLVVDDEEAVALVVGLRLAASGAGARSGGGSQGGAGSQSAVAEASARALAKVTQVMPPRLRRQVEAVAAMTEPASWGSADVSVATAVLTSAAIACRDAERVRFGYTAASGEQTQRHVEPHRLVALDRRWYLVGYDLDRQDWRTFRLDRVTAEEIALTGARFRPRAIPGGDAADFVRRTISSAPATYEVVAIVEAEAGVVKEKIGRWATIEDLGPRRCRVRMTPPEDGDWPVIALGMTDADFAVVSPAAVADRVRSWGERFTRAAGLAVSCSASPGGRPPFDPPHD
jgi:predicted DNA-binding transcriptional regulator YafY